MLQCQPDSLCSWNFQISGAATGDAATAVDWIGEQGTITYASRSYLVKKQGWLSGRWTLVDDRQQVFAQAFKPHPMFRRFQLKTATGEFVAQAATPFTRDYDLLIESVKVGAIAPVHAFTRRSVIRCPDGRVPELIQIFCFWLAVLTWRRAAENSSSTSG